MTLTQMQRGIIYMVLGVIIIFYALGFFKHTLNTVIIIGAILMILYGFFVSGLANKITDALNKRQ